MSETISHATLVQRQSLPLEAKIRMSVKRIREWAEAWDDEVYVAFSGGKDSTALLHLVRSVLGPGVPAVFYDTGLEFPEIKQFVKTFSNVVTRKPRMTYRQVVEEHGYPVVSKQASHILRILNSPDENNAASRRFYLTGIKQDGSYSRHFLLAKKWYHLIDAMQPEPDLERHVVAVAGPQWRKHKKLPFKIHNICCDIFKKEPAYAYEEESGKKPFIGSLATESRLRLWKYMQHGCNAYDKNHPTSTPFSFWTNDDVLQYLLDNKLPICSVYGRIERGSDGKLTTTGEQRTGCVWCMFGAEQKGPDRLNRFQRLAGTHPKIYSYCMEDMKLRNVLEHVGVETRPPALIQIGSRPAPRSLELDEMLS